MKNITSLLLAVALCGCVTGCTTFNGNKQLPTSRYEDPDRKFEIGKDMNFSKVHIKKGYVDKNGHTNYTDIQIDGLSSTNNPGAIDSAGNANANSILAGGKAWEMGFNAGGNFIMQMAAMLGQAKGFNTQAPQPQPNAPPAAASRTWPDELGAKVTVSGKSYTLSETGDSPLGRIRIFVDENGQRHVPMGEKMIPLTSDTKAVSSSP